jgi:hypothetical protein
MKAEVLPFSLRKNIIIVIATLFFSQFSNAQTFVTVGSASSTASTSGPTTSTTAAARTERHTVIYSTSELSSAGLVSNSTLIGIGWNKTAAGSYLGTNLTIRVWLKHNASTTFAANPSFTTETGSATLVYQTTTGTLPAATGVFYLPFNNNFFVWNGSDNIQVITEIIRSASWDNTSFSWTTIASVTNAAGNSNGATAVDALTRTGTRPQVRFEVATPAVDAALASMPNPVSATAGTQNIDVTLRNTGNTTVNNATISWKIDGATATNTPWSGSLNPGESTVVALGSSLFNLGSHTIEATITDINFAVDNNASNDNITKSIVICSILSGTYTINKNLITSGTNFHSFNDLAIALSSCGVSGNVIVNVASGTGPYNEQVIFQNIPGLSASSSVTINGNAETITSDTAIIQTGSNPNRHIIRLIGLQYFTINNLHIDMVTGSTGFIGVQALTSGSSITISNCVVNMGTATSTLLGGFVFNDDPASVITTGGTFNNITVSGNTVTGGGYGISVFGLTSPLATNVVISGNTFNNFSSNGVYLRETSGAEVSGNTFNKTAGSSPNAIQVAQTANINTRIFNNYIKMSQANGGLVGIYLFGGSGHKVYNNVIYDMQSTSGAVTGIQLRTASSGYEVYNNTISFDHPTATTGNLYGIRVETSATGAIIRNNIISISQPITGTGFKSGYMLNANTALNTTFSSDYNVFWVPGGYVAGYMNVTTPTLYAATFANWRSLTTQDVNSWEADPSFELLTLPRPTNGTINDKGISYGGLTTDILGVTRNSPPDIGAYEFTPATNDAAITNFISPPLPHCATTLNIQFELTNAGSGILNTATINWTVNGVPQTVVNWGGPSLASGASTVVTLGNVPVTGSNLYNFNATVSNPNSGTDANNANNSFTYTGFRRGMNGTFSIDKNASVTATNYVSFQSLANDLALYGACSPIVVNVVTGSGPYAERVIFSNIPGADATNTVTINGNGELIQYDATSAFPNDYTIKLDSASYLSIENLSVKGLNATNGSGIYITRQSSNIVLRNNNIEVSKTATASTTFGILACGATSYLLSGTLSQNLLITANKIIGGYSSIQLTGNAFTSVNTKLKNSTISNNIIQDFYGYGINLNYTDNIVLDSNQINRPTRTNSGSDSQTPAGIIANSGSTNFLIQKNTISDLYNTSMNSTELQKIARGIYIGGTSTATSSGMIQNNLIYGFSNTASQYGIQNNSTVGPINIYHNTVALNHTANTGTSSYQTVAMYLSNSTTQNGSDIRNNIFYITRGGASGKRVIEVSSGATSFTSNNNVLYINASAGANVIGRVSSTGYTSLADWQGTGKDVNSVNEDPQFVDESSGNFQPSNSLVDGNAMLTPGLGVATDITGVTRSANPDAGAFEFTPPLPVTLTNFRGERVGSINKLLWSTETEVNNAGFELQRSADGRNFSKLAWVATKADNGYNNTTLSYSYNDENSLKGNNYYRLKQIDKDGKYSYSTVVLLRSKATEITLSNVYPNPAQKELNLVITSPSAEKVTIVVTDLTGKVIMQQAAQLVIGDNQQQLQVQSLASGAYIIKVICSSGCETSAFTFLKHLN